MPLLKGSSEKAFKQNVRTEMHAGKPQKQSLAIAYSMKRKGKKMADGGQVGQIDPVKAQSAQDSMRKAFHFAEGGGVPACTNCGYQSPYKPEVDREFPYEASEKSSGFMEHEGDVKRPNSMALSEDSRKLNQHGEYEQGEESGGQGFHGESYKGNQGDPTDNYQTTEHDQDMVGRIMKQRQHSYSEGGKVANNTHQFESSFDDNEFDDLVLRDNLEASDTGANSGDELGNEREDEDRKDIVSRIMKSRAKKDRNPRPA